MNYSLEDLKTDLIEHTDFLGVYIDVNNVIGEERDFETIKELLETAIYEYQFIYFKKAMEFLSDYDDSLSESLEEARIRGYDLNYLNSEMLAEVLLQRYMLEELNELI